MTVQGLSPMASSTFSRQQDERDVPPLLVFRVQRQLGVNAFSQQLHQVPMMVLRWERGVAWSAPASNG